MIKFKDILNEIYKEVIPDKLYHATFRPLIPSIKKYGLIPGGKGIQKFLNSIPFIRRKKGIFLSNNPILSKNIVKKINNPIISRDWFDDIVILEINTKNLNNSLIEKDPYLDFCGSIYYKSFVYMGIIPPSAIMRMEDSRGNPVEMHSIPLKENQDPNWELKDKIKSLELSLKVKFYQLSDLSFCLTSNGKEIHLNSIRIKPNYRNVGIGREVMNRIVELANINNLYITLKPSPDKGYKEKLNQFYKSFGFYPNKGRRGLTQYGGAFGVYWIRPPKSNQMIK